MKVSQVIDRSSLLYPSDLEGGRVYEWLSELETRLCLEIHGKSCEPITADDADRVLTVPDAYAELYPLYIIMKTDLANGDIERYNNSAKSFKSSYDAYACYVNRTRELGDYNAITLL